MHYKDNMKIIKYKSCFKPIRIFLMRLKNSLHIANQVVPFFSKKSLLFQGAFLFAESSTIQHFNKGVLIR